VKPYLSIVIPVYNREHEIGRAIESCLNQSYEDLQVIVVDDCSTDSTVEVIRSYKDSRVVLVSHSINRGQWPATNSGVERASGDWVLFLDSDDELSPRGLSTVIEKTRQSTEETARLAFCYQRDDGLISPSPTLGREVMDYETYLRWTENVILSDFVQCVRRTTFFNLRFPNSRASALLYQHNFALKYRTRMFSDVVACLHTDAGNRQSGWAKHKTIPELSLQAVDQAASIDELLKKHGASIYRIAPCRFQLYRRMRATYYFVAGLRGTGFDAAAECLRKYPLSLRTWMVLALGLMGPRALVGAARIKQRLSR
jgi:glycosyltransferase involved in cell wall biosynthesis